MVQVHPMATRLGAVAAIILLAGTAQAQVSLTFGAVAVQPGTGTTLAVPTSLGPNVGSTTFFSLGATPVINNAGTISFAGTTSAAGNPNAYFQRGALASSNTNIILTGTTTVGGSTFTSFSPVQTDSTSANNLYIRGTIGSDTFLISGNTGAVSTVIRNATPSIFPVASGGTGTINYSLSSTQNYIVSSGGTVVAPISLVNSTGATGTGLVTTGTTANNGALVAVNGGTVTSIFRRGDQVGTDNVGTTPTPFFMGSPNTGLNTQAINRSGQVVFVNSLQGSSINTTSTSSSVTTNPNYVGTRNDNIIGLSTPSSGVYGAPTILARAGDQAPGLPTNVLYDNFSFPTTNNAGNVAFLSTLRNGAAGAGVSPTSGAGQNNNALFSNVSGTLTAVVRQGSPIAPGDTRTFGSFSNMSLNGQGTITFASGLGGTGGGLTNIFQVFADGRIANVLPGIFPAGLTSEIFGSNIPAGTGVGTLQSMAVNGRGQIAIYTILSNNASGVDPTNNRALLATDPYGNWHLIARSSDFWAANEGGAGTLATPLTGLRQIASSAFGLAGGSGGQDGRAMAWNDDGTLTFSVNFSDSANPFITGGGTSTGVYTVTIVPAPGAAGLLAAAGLMASRRRRA